VRERLDTLLVARGLFASRAQARAAILAGEVRAAERVADKPGMLVDTRVALRVAQRARYVSRGGDKLDHAMLTLGVEVRGEDALDLGSSTGGFVDRMLQGGAAHVVAVDVGYGQLDYGLRQDSRVTVLERTNARHLRAALLPYRPSFVTADLSFISLTVVLEPVLESLRQGYRGLVLVKPQFEAGRAHVGKGGVVRDPQVHRKVLEIVGGWLQQHGARVLGMCDSGHPGPKGNVEYFIYFCDARSASAAEGTQGPEDLAARVRRAVEVAGG
jgi:23S rRNA (cytidine1920-2'-O)/16S rRNA (cytidine1409-2'-O)-methyltransferase